jgi:uncharacterized protein (TIGR02145 family)
MFKYTHIGTGWDAVLMPNAKVDYLEYFVNGVFYSNTSLNGYEFPIGVSLVKVMAYFDVTVDSCEFNVTVVRVCPPSIPDEEGNVYKVTKLAGLCWTENLKTTLIPGTNDEIPFARPYTCFICPDGLESTFGLLYTWYSALNDGSNRSEFVQGICPEYWHVPSQEEWSLLSAYDSKSLRSKQYWLDPPGSGTDEFGFDARPAGWYNGTIGRFVDMYGFAGWWASNDVPGTETSNSFIITYYCTQVEKQIKKKIDGLSVRCVMD